MPAPGQQQGPVSAAMGGGGSKHRSVDNPYHAYAPNKCVEPTQMVVYTKHHGLQLMLAEYIAASIL